MAIQNFAGGITGALANEVDFFAESKLIESMPNEVTEHVRECLF